MWIDGEGEWNEGRRISTRRPVICSISCLVNRTIKSTSIDCCRRHGIDRETAQIRVSYSVPAQVPTIAAVCTLVNACGVAAKAIEGGDIKRGGRQRIDYQGHDKTSS